MREPSVVMQSLEALAEKHDNFTAEVYQRFFTQYPEAKELFGTGDIGEVARESMMAPLLMGLVDFAEGRIYEQSIERWVSDHRAYGVTLPMYNALFESLLLTLQEVLADTWNNALEQAWRDVFDGLLQRVNNFYQKA